MDIIKIRAKFQKEIFDALKAELSKGIPEDTKAELEDMGKTFAEIHNRGSDAKAIPEGAVKHFNELCYKLFPQEQDGGEFVKEEQPEEKVIRTDRFDFGDAIHLLKNGAKLSRDGWNGKQQYIILAKNIRFDSVSKKDIEAIHQSIGSQAIAFVGTSGVQMGWLASQADMLAEDWHCVEVEK